MQSDAELFTRVLLGGGDAPLYTADDEPDPHSYEGPPPGFGPYSSSWRMDFDGGR